MEEQEQKILPVWFWVGLVLTLYGIIVVGCGLYAISHPSTISLATHNPALWWGCVILVAGLVFLRIGMTVKE